MTITQNILLAFSIIVLPCLICVIWKSMQRRIGLLDKSQLLNQLFVPMIEEIEGDREGMYVDLTRCEHCPELPKCSLPLARLYRESRKTFPADANVISGMTEDRAEQLIWELDIEKSHPKKLAQKYRRKEN